ncbi:GNAT family N-acetyltransferase [Nocardia huaxiensis]|uniref:N-acetyltransferase n=1 Tax=Nocardia huaxiensis TaxID=2755382 RepID=A0A7D6VD89_9NOCA|nr:N-acetyltransferase [Nocardia huaxiensis]QLY32233.1 N-acetyltransferase [Nocardia huaxiensis]UFS94061.1 N-acetyltransferase [Nocardia huaxiensis]
MLIRRERTGDAAAIDAVHRSAFAAQYANANGRADDAAHTAVEPVEVALVRQLRDSSAWMPTLTMVAEVHDDIVGHVCLTRAGIGPFPVLALGPIGVRADHQGSGVGGALMHAVLGAADALDEPLIGLLGHLDYYPRFGFVPGIRLGIVPDQPDWTSHFQVRPLAAYDAEIKGEFRYADAFYDL